MMGLLPRAVALAIAMLVLIRGVSVARLVANHNQTQTKRILPGVVALAIAMLALIPGLSAARLVGNHNQTLLD